MSSLLEKALKKIEDSKDIQEEEEIQKDDKSIKIKDLKPPKAPKAPKIKENIKDLDLDEIPGYWEWCNSSETKRFYYYTKIGSVHRGSSKKMVKDLEIKQKEIKDVKEIMEVGRGTNLDRKALITELKIALKERNKKLAKQKEKIENV